MKTVTIPFDLELAKKIQDREIEGRIVNGEGTLSTMDVMVIYR